jgi:molybdenum cofactor biosynthesis protein B
MSSAEHRALAPATVACAVLTISDTRTEPTDTSGRAMADMLAGAGHRCVERAIVRDEPAAIAGALERWLARADVDAILTTGGTGISSRDGTIEVVDRLLEKRLDGFGELFRLLSYQDIGAAAMMSRACAGLARGRILLALPGSEAAVRLAMTKLVLPELAHMVQQARR